MGYEETVEMYEFARRMCSKYHSLIVADYDVDLNIFNIAVKWPGAEEYVIIPVPAGYPDEETLEKQIKEALEQLRKEKNNAN